MNHVLRTGREAAVDRRTVAASVWASAGALIAAAPAALRLLAAANGPLCPMRAIAHLSCPTCGLTRALVLLGRGDLAASLALHPWAIALAVQVLVGWALWGAWVWGWQRQRPDRWVPRAVAVNVAALVVIWLMRLVTGTLPPG